MPEKNSEAEQVWTVRVQGRGGEDKMKKVKCSIKNCDNFAYKDLSYHGSIVCSRCWEELVGCEGRENEQQRTLKNA